MLVFLLEKLNVFSCLWMVGLLIVTSLFFEMNGS